MSIGGMTPMSDEHSHRYSLPGVHTISSVASSPADMTEDRRLPPLPREPLPRDPFNQFPQRIFAPSPPSSHDSFQTRSPWPPAEHSVVPSSPASSTDSWLDSVRSHTEFQWPPACSVEKLLSLIAPNPRALTRKRPLQQACGRKRRGSMISGVDDEQKEKHRVAEGTRRKNLSQLHLGLDFRLDNYWLRLVGWDDKKNLAESKEHILQASIRLIDFMRSLIIQLVVMLIGQGNNELPCYLQEMIQDGLRCSQLEQMVASLQQQNQMEQQKSNSLRQENQRLEECVKALEYQVRTGHMHRSPKSEQSSPQLDTLLPNSKPKAILPGLRVFHNEITPNSPDSSRLNTPSTGTSQSFGQTFLSRTPSTTGPSSPVFSQPSYFANGSQPLPGAQSP
ncbi:hypothetical protein ASPCAL03783 [Aspergillus calidoustus]|uniref:Uncharacterized protein n=1 Tax=Aspergillus calidoustus TaxID=454130 RepID=A0A0U5FWV5_ASPCI|nr:hypothetical protein ASPCAL03783 [Aspergillus calidoustus]